MCVSQRRRRERKEDNWSEDGNKNPPPRRTSSVDWNAVKTPSQLRSRTGWNGAEWATTNSFRLAEESDVFQEERQQDERPVTFRVGGARQVEAIAHQDRRSDALGRPNFQQIEQVGQQCQNVLTHRAATFRHQSKKKKLNKNPSVDNSKQIFCNFQSENVTERVVKSGRMKVDGRWSPVHVN